MAGEGCNLTALSPCLHLSHPEPPCGGLWVEGRCHSGGSAGWEGGRTQASSVGCGACRGAGNALTKDMGGRDNPQKSGIKASLSTHSSRL